MLTALIPDRLPVRILEDATQQAHIANFVGPQPYFRQRVVAVRRRGRGIEMDDLGGPRRVRQPSGRRVLL